MDHWVSTFWLFTPRSANDDAFDANGLYTMLVINDAPWVGS